MKTLDKQFNTNSAHLRQLWRKGDVAVFARSLSPKKEPHELELVVVKVRPEQVMPNGDRVEAHEAYPKPSEWGTSGWSIPVRYKTAVMDLAEQLAGISKDRASFVRAWLHKLWLTEKTKS